MFPEFKNAKLAKYLKEEVQTYKQCTISNALKRYDLEIVCNGFRRRGDVSLQEYDNFVEYLNKIFP